MKNLETRRDNPSEMSPSNPEGEKETFNVESFLVEPKNDHREAIESATKHGSSFQKEYTEYIDKIQGLTKKIGEVPGFLRKKTMGKILIDLGAGGGHRMQDLAKKIGAKVYIKVDKTFGKDETPFDPSNDLSAGKMDGEMQVVTIKDDLLDFISRIPDGSVCITINGINSSLIEGGDYHDELAEEIGRAMHPDGVVFGRSSDCLTILSRRFSVQRIREAKLKLVNTLGEFFNIHFLEKN